MASQHGVARCCKMASEGARFGRRRRTGVGAASGGGVHILTLLLLSAELFAFALGRMLRSRRGVVSITAEPPSNTPSKMSVKMSPMASQQTHTESGAGKDNGGEAASPLLQNGDG